MNNIVLYRRYTVEKAYLLTRISILSYGSKPIERSCVATSALPSLTMVRSASFCFSVSGICRAIHCKAVGRSMWSRDIIRAMRSSSGQVTRRLSSTNRCHPTSKSKAHSIYMIGDSACSFTKLRQASSTRG